MSSSRRRSALSAPSAVKSPPSAPDESVAVRADARVAADAIKRHALGQTLSRREQAAIARQEKLLEAKRLARAYASCAVKDVCAILGVQRTQLQRYIGYGMPVTADGTYNLATTVQWVLAHERQRLKAEQAKGVDALEQMRQVDADRKRLEYAELRGELGPVAHFESVQAQIFGQMRREMESWPSVLAPRLAGHEPRQVQAMLGAEVRKLLERFAGGALRPARPRRRRRRR